MGSILVIEDNPSNMKLAVFLLEKEGYDVLQASDAEEGIRIARQRLPALILMDVQLPGMDGLAATRLLKADAATQPIKILALTAFAMRGDQEKIRAAGCDAYIAKPIRYEEFLKVVADLLVEQPGAVRAQSPQ
ncbi:response regulator [Limnohabitans sp. B9-3]|uniref:response regulator n=1 Tax=Limnohabitans sp. B9-3 TaxID=1100707 RepID=UPI000C1F76A0|nr:response regulator [Limnohabitans sp. B9-3]PIT73659.1 response regulator [Limnohabitans sp. B9-3]